MTRKHRLRHEYIGGAREDQKGIKGNAGGNTQVVWPCYEERVFGKTSDGNRAAGKEEGGENMRANNVMEDVAHDR